MFKSSVRAMAAAGAAAIAIGTILASKSEATPVCTDYSWGTGCVETISGSVERIGLKWNNGEWIIADVTCTGQQWILHSGWKGTLSRTLASEVAEGYCDGRGSMF